jgi:hypothetical protein
VEATISRVVDEATERWENPTSAYTGGARVSLCNPTIQHPGLALEQLAQENVCPFTKLYYHIVDTHGITAYHCDDSGLHSLTYAILVGRLG